MWGIRSFKDLSCDNSTLYVYVPVNSQGPSFSTIIPSPRLTCLACQIAWGKGKMKSSIIHWLFPVACSPNIGLHARDIPSRNKSGNPVATNGLLIWSQSETLVHGWVYLQTSPEVVTVWPHLAAGWQVFICNQSAHNDRVDVRPIAGGG
jgi:hypothetical protein